MRTGPLLVSDLLDRYQPLGAFGQPVYLSSVQLRATIAQKLGRRHADYFARPDRDPNGRMVNWVSEVPGSVRRWIDLPPDEQARVALDLHALRSDFLHYLGELRAQDADGSVEAKGAAAFASLLEQAMQVPDDAHLHIVGDQPVVSFWGFRGVDGRSVDPLATAPVRPAAAPGETGAAGSGAGGASAGGPSLAGPALAPSPRPWWRRWLWPLLGLLLLLLLLFLLAWCVGDERSPPAGALTSGGNPPGALAESREPDGLLDRTLRYFGLGGAVSGAGTADTSGSAPAAPVDTVVPGAATETLSGDRPGAGGETGKPDLAKPEESPAGGDAQKPLADERNPGAPPKPDEAGQRPPDQPAPGKQAPDQQAPGKQASGKQASGQPPAPPRPDAAGAGQPLQIPPDATAKGGDLGFVGGEWRSDSGLVDQTTHQPLQQTYRFDDKGKGEVVVRRADGVECRAAAQATMRDGRLGIEETARPTCPDGRSYTPSTTECVRTPSGQTVCQSRNADGSTYRVGIERAAPQP